MLEISFEEDDDQSVVAETIAIQQPIDTIEIEQVQ
jgi:hypothetical protein